MFHHKERPRSMLRHGLKELTFGSEKRTKKQGSLPSGNEPCVIFNLKLSIRAVDQQQQEPYQPRLLCTC